LPTTATEPVAEETEARALRILLPTAGL